MANRSKRAKWLERAKGLPTQPGVYLMKDDRGAVIYVGKAKNLKSRVSSYFQEGTSDYRAFIGLLSTMLADLETVVTRTEKEALILEREMIRRHEPRFNIIWRDDKQFLCLRVDPTHEYPWVQVVRNMGDDGARYFGPFHSASAARQTLRVVNRHFQLRTCRDSVLYKRKRPCLEHQIGRCPAPCVYDINRDRYQENVDDVLLFLDGKGAELADRLQDRMLAASSREEFEVAAHYRDQLKAVQRTLEKQQVTLSKLVDQDAFGLYREGDHVCVALVEVRAGRAENISTRLFSDVADDDSQILSSVIMQRYALSEDATGIGVGISPPKEVLVPDTLDAMAELEELLTLRRGSRAHLFVPKRGEKVAILHLARDNAEHGFHEQRKKTGALDQVLSNLQRRLRLRNVPRRIECFDISNLGDQRIVGSKVVFEAGTPAKKRYRRYQVRSTQGQDDFASMYEVLSRRFRRGLAENDLPDLVVIDGGKGQLGVAKAVFKDLGVERVDLISLAKSRVQGTDGQDAPVRSDERVFKPDLRDPVVLSQRSAELLLLARIRDEAHRFAITFQRELRRKDRLRSPLDDIPGVGPTRKKALLKHLGSLKRVQAASVEDLANVPGIGQKAAEAIYRALHPGSIHELVDSSDGRT
ncbi:MAG: excinuclease ABC subunit UvrC [Myxococcota bacterium]